MNPTEQPAWQQRPAPPEIELLQAFLNTHSYAGEPDHFTTMAVAHRWLRSHGLPSSRFDQADLNELVELREAIRSELLLRTGHPAAETNRTQLLRLLRRGTLEIDLDSDGLALVTSRTAGINKLFGVIAAEILTASLNGTWPRLKACGNGECQVVFYDHSRNGTARYCSSAVCANRVRQRAFRQRMLGE
jgi:predicted RNA-binding Zn ribbon-like protein